MNKILFAATLIMALSCNNNKTTTEKSNSTIDSTPKAIDPTTDKPKTLDEIKAGLEILVPLTDDQMKALFPQQLLGHDKSETDITTSMGAIAANTEYKLSDTSSVSVLIVDCAGPGGSGFFSMHHPENNNEKIDTENNMYYYFAGNRFLVTISGTNTGIELLKNAASEIKLDSN